MTLTINTDKKIIEVKEMCMLSDLFDELNKMFPNDGWKEYMLNISTQLVYTTPYVQPYNPIQYTYCGGIPNDNKVVG